MWSQNDMRFLRGLRIGYTDPPLPLSRFHVEPTNVEGRYCVIDTERHQRRPFRTVADFLETREAAEDYARQENEKAKS